MYELTLTRGERKAIDWIGNRYGHGDDLYKLLWPCMGEDELWGGYDDITFKVPEHVAWYIKEIAEECDYRWDCFAEELATKLTLFCERVV